MTHFQCTCGNVLFFENTVCLQCGSEVGYNLSSDRMEPVGGMLLRCRNGAEFNACNWLVPTGGLEYCPACCLNRTIPDLGNAANLEGWRKMEAAKRRVVHTLARLRLVPPPKSDRPDGVAFDFLAPSPNQRVVTGHEDGVITFNILEAHDPYREAERHALGEPYRTLVGHFRHELGHYYWDRFFRDRNGSDPLLADFRRLFGDERDDYGAALQKYYANGPLASWSSTHITAYATSHPWEDWAETWAQYLHIIDGAETAASFGWSSDRVPIPFTPFHPRDVEEQTPECDAGFLETLNGWAKLSPALNELAASLGYATIYPFVFSPASVRKILFVHRATRTVAESWNVPVAVAPSLAPVA